MKKLRPSELTGGTVPLGLVDTGKVGTIPGRPLRVSAPQDACQSKRQVVLDLTTLAAGRPLRRPLASSGGIVFLGIVIATTQEDRVL